MQLVPALLVRGDFIGNGCSIGASNLGGRREVLEMLDLAATKGIKYAQKAEVLR
jgi:D-arabinose 1-dehydrogenase-like Zn-dependent alcohol dehydrogenase